MSYHDHKQPRIAFWNKILEEISHLIWYLVYLLT